MFVFCCFGNSLCGSAEEGEAKEGEAGGVACCISEDHEQKKSGGLVCGGTACRLLYVSALFRGRSGGAAGQGGRWAMAFLGRRENQEKA